MYRAETKNKIFVSIRSSFEYMKIMYETIKTYTINKIVCDILGMKSSGLATQPIHSTRMRNREKSAIAKEIVESSYWSEQLFHCLQVFDS